MTQSLPYGNFTFLSPEEVASFDLNQIDNANPTGYMLKVDLSFPDDIHDWMNDFVMAPDNRQVTQEDLSSYQQTLHRKLYPEKKGKHRSKKLVACFKTRRKYIVHGECLKFYIEQGCVLEKVHQILSFSQRPFLKPFVEKCAELRAAASSPIVKQIYKLVANR